MLHFGLEAALVELLTVRSKLAVKNRLSFAEWTFIAYGSTLSLYLLLFLGSANFALRPEWDDQISNLYSTWIFWDHGTSLMTEPTGSFLTPLAPEEKLKFVQDTGLREENMGAYKAQPAYINWQNIPRNYPAGFHIMISPFAYVLKKNWLSLRTTLALETLCFLFICHITFVFIWRSVKPTGANRMEWGIFLLAFALLYFEALRWSLNSQYEMVPVFFMTLACIAYRKNRDLWCFVSAFAALFLHLRALFYIPLTLSVLYRNCESLNVKSILAQISQLRWRHWLIGLFALISTTLALITSFGIRPI